MSNVAQEARPWTRWWWMGNALNEAEVTRCLTEFRAAGFGGVEVSPIYGPKGAESRFVPFLSDRWRELFAHTVREAERLDLGVDLIAGTGWPFGGPWVSEADAAQRVWVERLRVGGEIVSEKNPTAKLLASQEAPDGARALFVAPTKQEVKRAAPGGEGRVLDHFNPEAARRYFAAFDDVAAPRCFFNDSWEVFGANAPPDILGEFQKRRGYDLRDYLREFGGGGELETAQRVRSDYRETIHELTAEFLTIFGEWSHRKGAKMRNQAHGSPGNLLDLYALADIPETEVFGPLHQDRPHDFGPEEEALLCRFASSSAHIAGKPRCSSECFTWLGEHAHVPLSDMKAEADRLFCMGINHIFYHGTPYSPADVPWPGWLFYASTLCAPTNPFWQDLPALNGYLARCQEELQAGGPDNDILLYFPFYDLLASEAGAQESLQFMRVHGTEAYLSGNLPEFVATARHLTERGWSFDLISDRQLVHDITVEPEGRLRATGKGSYRAVLVVGCQRMPPGTAERLAELAGAGAAVLMLGDFPKDVPGLAQQEAREAKLRQALGQLVTKAQRGTGLDTLLAGAGIARETMADSGLGFLRRTGESGGSVYFIANTSGTAVDITVPLRRAEPGQTVTLFDPLTRESGTITVTIEGVRLQLLAGTSLFVRIAEKASTLPPWNYRVPDETVGWRILDGEWTVEFMHGGPTLPPVRTLSALSDWTQWKTESAVETEALRSFSGTVRYRTTFDRPEAAAKAYQLDLGMVCHSARVCLNGEPIETIFAPPYRLSLAADRLQKTGNVLEVEVTNLMANRLAELERREGAAWRPFLMVNIQYKPFDAATWPPTPSGLLGPVRIGKAY